MNFVTFLSKNKTSSIEEWSIDESIDWTKIDLHAAEFIFSQAEKYLLERNETAKRTTERSYTLLAILIPVITVMIGIFCSSLLVDKDDIHHYVLFPYFP